MSHSSHGVVSVGFTTAYDTIASHRHLDTSARAGTTSNAQAARFVQVMNGPTGYSNDFKLHATNCNVVPYSPRAKADPVRWGGRFGIGQARFNQAFENPQASRVAPSAPTGYSRSPHAIFDGANTSSAPSAAPAATWGTMRRPSRGRCRPCHRPRGATAQAALYSQHITALTDQIEALAACLREEQTARRTAEDKLKKSQEQVRALSSRSKGRAGSPLSGWDSK